MKGNAEGEGPGNKINCPGPCFSPAGSCVPLPDTREPCAAPPRAGHTDQNGNVFRSPRERTAFFLLLLFPEDESHSPGPSGGRRPREARGTQPGRGRIRCPSRRTPEARSNPWVQIEPPRPDREARWAPGFLGLVCSLQVPAAHPRASGLGPQAPGADCGVSLALS